MLLGAYIDQNGNAYVGRIENREWLYSDMPKKYTRVLNENGGEIVTPEDISYAVMRHKPFGTSQHFDSEETMEYCLSFIESQKPSCKKVKMRDFLLIFALTFLCAACDMRDTPMKNADIAKELPYVWSDGQLVEGFTVYTIDSCEYIGQGIGSQRGVLTHKGNCRFCEARHNTR